MTIPFEWQNARLPNGSLIYKNGVKCLDVTNFKENERKFIRDWYLLNTVSKRNENDLYFIEGINRENEFYKEKFTTNMNFQKVIMISGIVSTIILILFNTLNIIFKIYIN